MKILAINTSGNLAEVSIKDDKKLTKNKINSPYSENIMGTIQQTLKDANLSVSDIDCFGVVTGPGSFTGIRIGMAVVKGLICGLNKKCIAINSFELISYNIKDSDFVVLCDSGNADTYYAIFKDGLVQEMGFGTIDDIKKFAQPKGLKIYFSSAEKEKFFGVDGLTQVDVSPDTLANLTYKLALDNNFVLLEKLSPVYIKLSQAEVGLEQKLKQNLSFRDANANDVNALSVIDEQCFDGAERYDINSFKEEIAEPSKHYIVALFGNLVIGYVGVQTLGEELNLLKIAVLPQYRRLGIGFKLLGLSFDYKIKNNLTNYFLEVRESNVSAQKLYQKFGFKTKSKREKYYSNGETALVMFAK